RGGRGGRRRGRGGGDPLPGGAADDDRSRRDGRDGAGGADARRGGTGMSDSTGAAVPAYRVWALPGIPEVRAGDDLVKLIAAAATAGGLPGLADGDVLLVTSKIVSKAEGRIVEATDREEA